MQLDKLMNTKGLPRYIKLSPLKYDGKNLSYDIKITWWGMVYMTVKAVWNICKHPNDFFEYSKKPTEGEQNNAL